MFMPWAMGPIHRQGAVAAGAALTAFNGDAAEAAGVAHWPGLSLLKHGRNRVCVCVCVYALLEVRVFIASAFVLFLQMQGALLLCALGPWHWPRQPPALLQRERRVRGEEDRIACRPGIPAMCDGRW